MKNVFENSVFSLLQWFRAYTVVVLMYIRKRKGFQGCSRVGTAFPHLFWCRTPFQHLFALVTLLETGRSSVEILVG